MGSALTFDLEPERPYALERTLARLTRFPEVVDRVDAGVYRRLLTLAGARTLIRVEQRGSPSRALLAVELRGRAVHSAAARAAAERFVRRALGAGQPVRGFYRAFRSDPLLAAPIARERGLRLAGAATLFEALVGAVLSQQVNLGFAHAIRRALALRYGARERFGGETFIAFPTPERLARQSLAALRALKLSGAKAAAVFGLAQAFASGQLAEADLEPLDDEAVIERLTALRGVGRWTAEIAMMRGLARPDVFPAADLGVVKHLALGLLGRAERAGEREMRQLAERWRPYRSLALLYAYAELAQRARAQAAPSTARKTSSPA